MARQKKRPTLEHCRVSRIAHPKTPWRVSWPIERDGKTVRTFKRLADEDAAWSFAEATDRELVNHGARYGVAVDPAVRRAFDLYRDRTEQLTAAGASVPSFDALVAEALDRIAAEHAKKDENSVTVAEALASFLDFKKTRVRDRQLTDLKTRLLRFAQDFGRTACRDIATADISAWLAGLRSRREGGAPLAALSRNHYRANLHAFFEFAAAPSRRWVDRNPVAELEKEVVEDDEPQAYAPDTVAALMQAALDHKPDLLPVLALGMFCGLRVSEALEIDLGTIDHDEDEFRVRVSKTGPRMAPLTEAAKAWLAAQPPRRGKAWEKSPRMLVDGMQELFAIAGVEPIANGARHSFISYRTAETRDVAKVADECGNSMQTIKAHYRQLVTANAAKKFFGLRPLAKLETGRKHA
jgi:integrase